VWVCVCMYYMHKIHTGMHIRTYIHTHMYAYISQLIYTYMYICTCMCIGSWWEKGKGGKETSGET